jgi:hypothetical protein
MSKRKWLSLVIGTSLIGGGLSATSASAVPPNQSDITGTNYWNNTAPIFRNGGRLDPEILSKARRLSGELEQASGRCCNVTAKPVGPRRFARTPGTPQVCDTPECQRLTNVVGETRAFLNDVNRSQVEVQTASRNRLW